MKKIFLRITVLVPALLLFVISGYTQQRAAERVQQAHQQQKIFTPVQPNVSRAVPAELAQNLRQQVTSYNLFEWTAADAATLEREGAGTVELTLPLPGGSTVTLELVETDIFAPDFVAITSEGERIKQTGAHYYQGTIKGEPATLAAISIFNDEIAGFFATAEGNYVTGKLKNTAGGKNYNIIYKESQLTRKPVAGCSTPDITIPVPPANPTALTYRCARMYFETEQDFYTAFGNNSTSVNNYVTNLFNQVKTLYNNDNISVTITQIYIWTTADPYTGTTSLAVLNQFKSTRTSFNGDVGQLLTTRNIGGGRAATTNGLCGSVSNKLCVSGNLTTSFANIPTYSWEVNVTAHEFGHLLGSQHTHACAWNGNNTAIDGCGPTANASYAEGSCATGPLPPGGGTIMSYCHLLGTGINFNNGFGAQPAARIRNAIEAGNCLVSCAPPCPVPTGLSSSAVGNTTATISWSAVSGAVNYVAEYKANASNVWLPANTSSATFRNLTGLVGGTLYDWRVRTLCDPNGSDYASGQFTTTGSNPCGTGNMGYAYFSGSGSTAVAAMYWTAVPGATSYNIWILQTYSAYPVLYASNVTGTSYLAPAPACCYLSGSYAFGIQPNCSGGTGVLGSMYYTYKTYTGRMANGETVSAAANAGKQPPAGLDAAAIADNKLLVAPVPATGTVTLRYNSPASGRAVITVTDQLGVQMPAGITTTVHAGSNTTTLDINKLHNGVYTVKLHINGRALSSKLVVAGQ